MEKSSFQFTTPVLKRLVFEVNEDFVKKGTLNMKIHLTANIQFVENKEGAPGNAANVTVTLSVGTRDNSTPFYLEADESADFRWKEGVFDEKQIDNLLNQNAVALLISYLRPIVSNVTSTSPYPAYNLPYMDLTSSNHQ